MRVTAGEVLVKRTVAAIIMAGALLAVCATPAAAPPAIQCARLTHQAIKGIMALKDIKGRSAVG